MGEPIFESGPGFAIRRYAWGGAGVSVIVGVLLGRLVRVGGYVLVGIRVLVGVRVMVGSMVSEGEGVALAVTSGVLLELVTEGLMLSLV